RAAHRRALAAPAAAAGLAAGDVLVVDVADLADGRPARQRNAAHLARGQAQDAVALVLRNELDARARRTRHLAALARLQLDVVNERAGRDVRQRQRIAGLDIDLAVEPLVPTALVAPRDAAVHVSPAALLERAGQAFLGLALRDLLERGDRHEPPARGCRLVPPNGHG